MHNGRRLGRGVESRIVATATYSAIVSSRAIAEAVGTAGTLLAAAVARIFRRLRDDSRTLPNKEPGRSIRNRRGREDLQRPPESSMMGLGHDESEASKALDAGAAPEGCGRALPLDRARLRCRVQGRPRFKSPRAASRTRLASPETESPRPARQSDRDPSDHAVSEVSPRISGREPAETLGQSLSKSD